jgi:DMSO/TMAO reductase YedYZ molybdopterin-dependent catalytic subunit
MMNAHESGFDRRQFLRLAAAGAVALPVGCGRKAEGPAVSPPDAPMRFPGKVPMRVVNDRAPCLESPWSAFRTDITPNDEFFVRWHLQLIPTMIDTRTWRLKVGGHVDNPVELSLDDLKRMDRASVIAVNQCSGNSRGLFEPPVPGGQWRNGAMGNADWTGVRLKDVLDKAGIKAGAVEVTFTGLDKGGLPTIPDFTKALKVDNARDPELILAYEMNREPLPMLNGFPLRLIKPGWYATYWVKALSEINVVTKPFEGFWMKPGYRIPPTKNGVESPTDLAKTTIPINRLNVRSFFTTPDEGARVPAGRPVELDGIAFDGGSGIKRVDVSADDGKSWVETTLGKDLGRYSFRRWRLAWTPPAAGNYRLLVRATANDGEVQPAMAGWNRSGYMRNVIEGLDLHVV